MLLNNIPVKDIYIACGYTDMRKSIDGLAAIVRDQLKLDPYSSSLFLFCGKRRDRLKALVWEPTGFLLLYKRLEAGSFRWPMSKTSARQLSKKQLEWLLDGLAVDQPKAIREIEPCDF